MRKFLRSVALIALAMFVGFASDSCTRDVQDDVGGAINLAGLDETGLQFIEMLQKRPDWKTDCAQSSSGHAFGQFAKYARG